MKYATFITLTVFSLILTACGMSSGPSEGNIKEAISKWESRLNVYGSQRFLDKVGLNFGDVFSPEVEVINVFNKDEYTYIVKAKYNFIHKKSKTDYSIEEQTAILGSWGVRNETFNKGDKRYSEPREREFQIAKGEKGWDVIR